MSKRIARLNEQFKRELAILVREEVRDPRVGSATITGVEVAGDLGSARVFVRVGGGSEAMAETLRGLEAAAPFLRSRLGRMLHVRKIPELRFREDRSLEGARRIEEVLSDIIEIPDADTEPDDSGGVSEDGE